MADQNNDDRNPNNPRSHFQPLPLEARRRLWDQIWNRLLAPPVDPEHLTHDKDQASDGPEEAADDVAA